MSAVARFDVEHARKLTERIRMTAVSVSEKIDRLKELVNEAKESEAHLALGYSSWTAYLADVLGETPMRLERDVRRELVAELSEQGMSTRAIAPIVGTSHMQVKRDVDAGVTNVTPEPEVNFSTGEVSDGFMRDRLAQAEDTGEVVKLTGEGSVSSPRAVTGLDGKQYKRPEPSKPKRRALTDTARDAGWDLRKAVEKIERIRQDDRFSRNENEVTPQLRSHLIYAIETCQGILDGLTTKEQ